MIDSRISQTSFDKVDYVNSHFPLLPYQLLPYIIQGIYNQHPTNPNPLFEKAVQYYPRTSPQPPSQELDTPTRPS